ncbi:MAG TPA: PASTA domain-containing protein, partial [Gaiellaceae bacterium]
ATQVAPPRRDAPRRPPPYTPGYGYEEPPPKRRRWAPWLLVALLLAGAAFAGWYVFTKIQDQLDANATVPVPGVVGLQEANAKNLIEKAGLTPKVQRTADKEVKAGIVISQNPDGGVRIQKGDQVTIVVSTGVPKTTVPDVVGLDYADAVDKLNEFNLNARKREVFSKKPEGQVVSQNPRADEVVPEDSTVVLKVSKGQATANVPDVIGQSESSATDTLQAAGFKVQSVQSPCDSQPAGFVCAQSPDGGTEATKGSTVTITVSSGPSSTTVPNVVGEQKETAQDDLQNAGFKVKVMNVPVSDPTQDNVVQDQDPNGGESAPKGSKVTIYVGQF